MSNKQAAKLPAVATVEVALPPAALNADSGSATAKKAAKRLVEKRAGYVIPTSRQKRNLVVACAKRDLIVYGRAFDVLRLTGTVDLDSPEDVEASPPFLSS